MNAFVGVFLLFVIFRIVLNYTEAKPDHPCYLYMIPQISIFLVVSCWMLTVQNRIIHKKIKHQMFEIGFLFLLYFLMQMVKYCLFTEDVAAGRYMWYGYYVPMTLIPLLLVYILHNLSSHMEGQNKNDRVLKLYAVLALLISLGFLTNDFHQLAFGIVNWHTASDIGRTLGPVYYIYVSFMVILLLSGVINMLRLYRKNKKYLGLSMIPLILGIIYMVLNTVKPDWAKVNGRNFLELSEIFAFMIIGFLEICIQIRLIPSNIGYRRLFSLSEISARVLDYDGKTVYETQYADESFKETADYRIVRRQVKGGSFLYGVDFSRLNNLNRELDEIITDLESRNDLLRYENEIVLERKRPEEAIRIYDSISELVRPQILEVRELLSADEDTEDQFRFRLVRSAVLNAYIKRRSNMELESQKSDTIPFRELVTAAAESLEYFKLSGAETFLSFSDNENDPAHERYSAKEIICAYAAFETVTEKILGAADYLMVRFDAHETICMRFMLSGQDQIKDLAGLKADGCTMEYTQEDNDIELCLSLLKGREKQ